MSVTEAPSEVWVTLGERQLRLALPGEWTLEEALYASEITGGLPLPAIEQRLVLGCPRCWWALLQVMLRREGLPPNELNDVELVTMIRALTVAVDEKLRPRRAIPRGRRRMRWRRR